MFRRKSSRTSVLLASIMLAESRKCAERCLSVPSLRFSRLRVYALLALLRAKDVTSEKAFSPILADPKMAVALSLGLELENQPAEAARWLDQAVANGERTSQKIRQLFANRSAPVLKSSTA